MSKFIDEAARDAVLSVESDVVQCQMTVQERSEERLAGQSCYQGGHNGSQGGSLSGSVDSDSE